MELIGIPILFLLFGMGLAVAQYVFFRKTGRTFWRGLLPFELRKVVAPEDTMRLDSWMIVEEWTAFLLLGGYLTLPVLALNFIGFLHMFP